MRDARFFEHRPAQAVAQPPIKAHGAGLGLQHHLAGSLFAAALHQDREHLFNLVRSYVRAGRGRMHDPDMLREWQTLYYDDKNRVDHPEGEYSDCTVALGMALAVHSGGFDIPLEPLPIEQMDRGAQMYMDSIAAASMGGGHREQPSFEGMTMDEVMRYVETKHRRETSRLKNGLSGST